MKKLTILSLLIILALLLSSCQLHTGLGKLLNGGGSNTSSSGTPAKHVKATHTPPAPPTGSVSATATPTP